MSATVRTCVVWVGLPTEWNRRCKKPERMRQQFGPFTPQPYALLTPPGPMYLFCVAMDAAKATRIIEAAGAQVCCQPAEDVVFDVSKYNPRHTIRPTNRMTETGEEEYELVQEWAPPAVDRWSSWWRRVYHGPPATRAI